MTFVERMTLGETPEGTTGSNIEEIGMKTKDVITDSGEGVEVEQDGHGLEAAP